MNGLGLTTSFGVVSQASTGPVSVAAALTTLRLKPASTVAIADSLENIQKNLDALQGVAGRITGLTSSDAGQKLSVGVAQYQRDSAILAKWGEGGGNSVEVTGVSAANAGALVAAKPSWVSSITVVDSAGNLQRKLDELQTLVSAGSVRQIVRTGASSTLKITAAQLVANQDALGAIKNQAYSLAITNASVNDTLGLDGLPALSANARVKSIDVKDSTEAIETHLDALQRVGLRLKSISQTDAGTPLTVTAAQYWHDSVTIGKILTPYQLDVIRASAAQAAKIAANQKVVTVSVTDTAANLSRRWALMQRLSDSLTAIEVTDPSNALTISGDQLALGETLLGKFNDDADHGYKLAVHGVKAGQAAAVASDSHVGAVKVADSADNIAANLDALQGLVDSGQLKGIALTGKNLTLSMDAARLQGSALGATQGVLDTITSGNYRLAVTGATLDALGDLAGNAHVVAMEVGGSSDEIESHLDALHQLGKRVTRIQQSDSGAAIDVTQTAFDARAAVLAKIDGGFTVNVSAVTALRARTLALNSHVASLSVADSGKNLVASWTGLRSIGATLAGVTKTDAGSLSLSAADYLAGQNDQLLDKFDADLRFSVNAASVEQANEIGADEVVDKIDVVDDGSTVADRLSDLSDLVTAGKLRSIVLNAGATGLALHASQLDGARSVLDLVKGGRYTLAVDEVAVADAGALLGANPKIARLKVTGDAAGITGHLAELTAAGHKLTGIEQTDAADTALALSGADFEQHAATLAKITGGYQASLSDVAAAKASAFAASTRVKSLQVADSGAQLAKAWGLLGTLGAKLTGIAQTDSSPLQLTALQWSAGHSLGERFSTELAVSVSGASVADLATLGNDDAVQQIQLVDSADSITQAWTELAAESKLTQVRISDPTTALALSAETYAASTSLLGLISDGAYRVALSEVAVSDAASLNADSHVSTLDVSGSSSDIAAGFTALAALGKLGTIALSDENGTLSLSAAQVLGNADTLARISNGFQIAASGVSMADLAAIQDVDPVASIAISDSAAALSSQFDDILALGGSLAGITLSDATPVLTLTQQDWTSGAGSLAKIDGSWQADLSAVGASDAAALAAEATVRQLSVADTASSIASQWTALVAAYDAGAGKLVGLSLSDDGPLVLTEDQQTEGAAMIAALLADETIQTAA